MKDVLIILLFNLGICCGTADKKADNNTKALSVGSNKKETGVRNSTEKDTSGKVVTITVSYAAIACGCPHWFEKKYENVPFLEGVERFYLEPVDTNLIDANKLWDGERIPLIIRVSGRFSKEKLLPKNIGPKDEPEKARIFWYDKIADISPTSKH